MNYVFKSLGRQHHCIRHLLVNKQEINKKKTVQKAGLGVIANQSVYNRVITNAFC